ncbi:MAG TPA: hypothetical protein VGC42_01410 [Kofleriaceae bacterium]
MRKERVITFMDADDNTLLVRLAHERVQLAVIDSRPALEGGELRAFASALFRAYVAPPLASQLAEAASQLAALEAGPGLAAAQRAQLAAARRAIEAVQGSLAEAEPAEPGHQRAPAWLDPACAPARDPACAPARAKRRKPRTFRASDGELLDWGWTRIAA